MNVSILLLTFALLTPAQAVAAAAHDLATIVPGRQGQTRYLMLPGSDVEERKQNAQAISFLLNSVSRAAAITLPQPVDDQWQLLRIDLAAYSDLRNLDTYKELFGAWEQLAQHDPYLHIRTQILPTTQNLSRLSQRAAAKPAVETVTTDGGWVGLEEAARLKELSFSFGAVLRADYFVSQVAGPAYYTWAGIPAKEADFFKLFGVDEKTLAALAADSAANLLRSGVTRKPRRIIERPSVFGSVFQTQDVDAESPDRDPLRNPIDFREQRFNFQASELFALGSNRLWRVALYDATGNRVDAVPDKVAKDFAGDGIIRPLLSCLRCHERNGGLAGLQPFHDDQFDLVRAVGVSSYVPEVVQRISELYNPGRMGKAMARAREDYTDAVASATQGMTPAGVTDALVQLYAGYVDQPVSPNQAELELGLAPGSLSKQLATSSDPIVLALVAGKSVNRAAWEATYAGTALEVINDK